VRRGWGQPESATAPVIVEAAHGAVLECTEISAGAVGDAVSPELSATL
jgi:hypothetical protein